MRGLYILGFVTILIMSCNCSNYNYANAVKNDTERIFKSKKSFFQSLAFKGIVNSKDKCEKCNINKFTISIMIEERNQEVSFQNEQYQPYYAFKDKELSMSVNQEVFEKLKKGDLINKKPDSRFLEANDKQLEILHSQKLIWLP